MQQADCISIHIPNINDNISFIDSEKLSWMKSGAALINTARGPIVNEDALYVELKNKRLIAAFDVFWDEPYNGKLCEFFPNSFYMSPHVSSSCNEFIDGCKTYSHLPPHEEFSLYHPKTIKKQEQQNKFYMDNFSRDLLVRK